MVSPWGPGSIEPVRHESGKMHDGEEVSGELVITAGDAAKVLEAAEASLDDVSSRLFIRLTGVGFWLCLLSSPRPLGTNNPRPPRMLSPCGMSRKAYSTYRLASCE
jgi:hypothetical protein